MIIASVVKPQPRGQLESNCCKAWANLSLVGAHSRREAHATIVHSTESTLLRYIVQRINGVSLGINNFITTISQIWLNTHANPAELDVPTESTNYI